LAKLKDNYSFKHVPTLISNKAKHTLSSSTPYSNNMEQGNHVKLHTRKIVHISITSYLISNKGERSITMHKAIIRMMHASSYSSSQDCQPKVAITFYVSGITLSLSIYS
jgi:hypothetical protein